MKESNIPLLIFATLYTIISIYFLIDLNSNESASIAYLFLFPMFWCFGGIIFGLLYWLAKIKIKTNLDRIALAFSTPLPLLVFFALWTIVVSIKQ